MPRRVMKLYMLGEWYAACMWGLGLTLVLRIGLGLTMGLSWLVSGLFFPLDMLTDPSLFDNLVMPKSFPGDVLLGVWPRWDAVHHLNLAQSGYFGVSVGSSVFYPLYAFLTRIATRLTGGNYIIGGLVVSTLATFVSFTCLYRLADAVYGPRSARGAVLALAVYPTSVFLIAPFTESLFLALTLGTFVAAYRQKWWIAGALGFFASLARGPGMLTSIALAVIVWQQWQTSKPANARSWLVSVGWGLVMPVAGGLAFIAWRAMVGFPSMSEVLRQYSGLVMTDPISGLAAAIAQWRRVFDFYTTLDVLSAFLFVALTILMMARSRWRRLDWLAYTVANLLLFLSKQTFAASSLQSMSRYVLILFPIFITIGDWLAHQSRRLQFFLITLSSSLLVMFSMLYTLWVFIG